MKLVRIAAIGAAAALALTACGTDSDKEATDSAKPSGPSEITVWLAGETDTPEDAVTYLKTEANKQEITVNVERIGWEDLVPKVTTSIADPKSTPDVVELGNTQVQAFSTAGAFRDITGLWADLDKDNDLTLGGFVEGGSYNGKLYAAPYYSGSRIAYYNSDLVKEVPETLADFNKLAAELNTDKVSGVYLGGQDWRNGISWIFANGGQIATYEDGKWVGKLSTPESIKGLEMIQDIYENGTNAPKDADDSETWVPFNEGKTAMFMAPGWAAGSIEGTKDDIKWSAFALPGADGGVAPVFLGGSNIGISAKSQNPEAAEAVLNIMLSEPYQKILAEAGLGTIYAQHAELAKGDAVKEAAVASGQNGVITPASPDWAAFEQTQKMEELFFELASGGDVKEIAAKYDEILNTSLNITKPKN
ncbi:extracellular solute-binding protein [Timonella sp. A28]|uniref:extracellular solute-binding protein n=1 Tax=Timonella sp. A28 TaxID=3442640 RepID=UPI003EBD88E0